MSSSPGKGMRIFGTWRQDSAWNRLSNAALMRWYRDPLREYYQEALARGARGGHTPHVLEKALSWHINFAKNGTMREEIAPSV